MWAPGTVFGGRYTLAEQVTDGSAAEVWWADDAVLGRSVVVKILHPALGANAVPWERFRGEAELVAQLDLPGIAAVHREGRTDGDHPYVVVQFVDRSPLSARAVATASMPYEQIPDIVARTLEALHAEHRHALVRRAAEPSGPAPRTLGPSTRRPARERHGRRRRRSAVTVLPAAVIAAVAGTLFVLNSSADSGSGARADGPTLAQAPVVPGPATPEATPSSADAGAPTEPGASPSSATEDPTTTPPSPLLDPDGLVPTGGPALPPPPARVPVGPSSAGATTRTASGSTGGTGGTPAGGTSAGGGTLSSSKPPAAKPAAKPAAAAPVAATAPAAAAPAAAPAPAPAVPAGCGGAGWGGITNVGDGMKIGIDTASPGVGSRLVMGGHTEYGWVTAQVGPWQNIRTCNTGGLVIAPESGSGGPVSLGNTAYTTGLLTISAAPTPGAFLITAFPGQQCLADNGPGRQLTFTYCAPGNPAQQWYIP